MLAIKKVGEGEEGDYHIREETGNKRKKPYEQIFRILGETNQDGFYAEPRHGS